MEITSRENETFRRLLRLTQKKYRRAEGLCIIEGEKVVREHSARAVQIFIKKSCVNRNGLTADGGYVLEDKLFDAVSDVETAQGILAVVKIPAVRAVTYPYLVLDGVQDAGNMGTILRTAAAFGFKTVFCISCVDVWGAKVLRAGAGMQFGLNIIETDHAGWARYRAGELSGGTLFAADLNGTEVTSFACEGLHGKFGLVLGNEGNGISAAVRANADKVLTIKMEDGCESLNVAVAAGILMHSLRGAGRGK